MSNLEPVYVLSGRLDQFTVLYTIQRLSPKCQVFIHSISSGENGGFFRSTTPDKGFKPLAPTIQQRKNQGFGYLMTAPKLLGYSNRMGSGCRFFDC